MKSKTVAYWVSTALVAFAFGAGGLLDLARAPDVMTTMDRLGYPAYVATILGGWKVLGTVALLAPRFPRLKEWAYAGLVFDLSGAVLSHGFAGDPASAAVIPLILLALVFVSWHFRPETRRLPASRAHEDGSSSTGTLSSQKSPLAAM
jgi:hypothetical protein